eukprot:16738-Heterococcus_DN1.PRE.8
MQCSSVAALAVAPAAAGLAKRARATHRADRGLLRAKRESAKHSILRTKRASCTCDFSVLFASFCSSSLTSSSLCVHIAGNSQEQH